MFPFPMYPQPSTYQRGRGRGRPFRGRRGRGASRFQRPERPDTAAEVPPEKREEKKEVKEVIKSIPGVTLASCQIQLSITLRYVGFLTQGLFNLLQKNNVEVQCTCYQLYRIALFAVQLKMIKQVKRATPWYSLPETRPFVIERVQSTLESLLLLPKPFVDYISSIGDFELNSSYYNVFIPYFVGPHPLYVNIENLWGTVLALSLQDTPQMVRHLFYLNNPLPGAVWANPANPVLTNPGEFIHEHYDNNAFEADLTAVNALCTALRKKKWLALQGEKVDFMKTGDPAQLVSSSLTDSVVRCALIQPEGQVVEGNRTDFTITSPGVNSAQAFKGASNLYSEVIRFNGTVSVWDNCRTTGYQQLRVDWRSELRQLFTTS